MSINTMRRLWPADRYQRFLDLRTRARKSGLSTTVGNHGPKGAPVFSMTFSTETTAFASHFDIGDAEVWLDIYEGGRA